MVRNLSTIMFFFLAVWCLTAATALHAEQPGGMPGRESLKGLVGLAVLVEPLNIEIEHLGLHTSALQQDIRHRLQKAGLRVVTDGQRPPSPLLIVRVDARHDRIGRYFYSIDLLVTQRVHLDRHAKDELSAATWINLGGIGSVADDDVKQIHEQVLRKIDQFIRDVLEANRAGD